jgi:3-ketosteroid 9alpha-monooxygenase subunit A
MPKPERLPQPIPYGWYFVSYCDELAPGDVKPVHYFGRDLVMFRTDEGKAGLLDAYCPHLGAHLGYGGHVKGDSIHCPFHGWSFRPDGWCSGVPYAKAMPLITQRQAVIQSYPLTEANGVVWAWYHPHNVEPLFDVEVYPEFTDPSSAKQIRHEWRAAINVQEQSENAVDTAHFQFIHKAPGVPDGFGIYEGHRRRTGTDGTRDVEQPDGTIKKVATAVRSWASGPGQKNTMLQGVDATVYLMVLVTPIEADDLELRFAYTATNAPPGSAAEAVYKMSCERISGELGLEADLPIWNHKIHRARPILCDGDGPILAYRKWFEQFYDFDKRPQSIAAE